MTRFHALIGISILVAALLVSNGCDEDSPEAPIEKFLIPNFISLTDGDTIATRSSLALRFSAALDTTSFAAAWIDTLIAAGAEVEAPDTLLIVHESARFLLDDEPLTFIYDPSTAGIALMAFNSIHTPEGSGEGFILESGNHVFQVVDGLTSTDGLGLETPISLGFRAEVRNAFRPVPNPFQYGQGHGVAGNYLAFITDDPRSGTLRITDLSGMEILEKTFSPVENGFLDKKALSDYVFNLVISRTLKTGIYGYELEYAPDDLRRGFFVMLIGR